MEPDFEEVFFSYTDAQAVEDGVLVALSATNRASQGLWSWLVEHVQQQDEPPSNWQVPLLDFCRAKTPEMKAMLLLRGLIEAHGAHAAYIYEHNIGGGIWTGLIHHRNGRIVRLEANVGEAAEAKDSPDSTRIWIMPNELGGLTAMLPEDY